MNIEWMRVSLALLFVLGLILVLSWLVKRINGVNLSSSNGFQSIATMILGPKEKLILVLVGEQYLLMGIGAASVTMLYDFGRQLPKGFDLETKQGLSALLKSTIRKP